MARSMAQRGCSIIASGARTRSPPGRSARRAAGSARSSPATASRCGRSCRGTSSRSRCSRPCVQARVELGVEALLPPPARTSTVAAPWRVHRAQRVDHVGELRLDHVDHRAVPEPGVGPEQQEQVREAGDGRAEVGARAALPHLVERPPAAPAHPVADRQVGGVEAGAEDDRVDLALLAVAGHDGARVTRARPPVTQLDVGLRERRDTSGSRAGSACSRRVVRA